MIELENQPVSAFTPEQLVIEKQQSNVQVKDASAPAFYAAALDSKYDGNPQKTVDLYNKIKTDLETVGVSPDYDAVVRLVKTDSDKYNQKAMLNILGDQSINPAEKRAIVEQYIKERDAEINLTDEYVQHTYASEEPATSVDAEHKEYDASFVFDRIRYFDEIEAARNKVVSDFDPAIQSDIIGFMESIMPFMSSYHVQKVKEQVFGEESTWETIKGIIFTGENVKEIRDSLMRMPYDRRVEASKQLLTAISHAPGFDFKKMAIIQALVEDPEYSNVARGVDDLVGVLDLVLVGSAVKGIVKPIVKSEAVGGLLSKKSQLGVTAEANKTLASRLAADAINAPTEDLAKAVGGSKISIASTTVLPKWSDDVLRDLPSDVIDELNKIEKIGDDVYQQVVTNGINYSTAEKVQTITRVNEELASVDGLTLHLNKSIMASMPKEAVSAGSYLEGYSGIAMYGSTAKNGFSSATKALSNAGKNFKDAENLILYKKNLRTGDFSIVDDLEAEIGKKGSYFVGYKFSHTYNPLDVAIYGEDAVTKLGASKLGGYMFDVVSRFDRYISQSALRAADKATAIEKRLIDTVGKDIASLNNTGKKKVFYALEEGAKQSTMFDPAYLKNKFELSDKEIKAYYSYRKVSDVMWSLTNSDLLRKLRADNMLSVRTTGSTEHLFAKQLDESYVRGSVRTAYNPTTGAIENVSKTMLDKLFSDGGSIGRMSRAKAIGNHVTDYIIVDNKASKLDSLRTHVLPYIDGYFQRTYKEFYFVDRIPTHVVSNGTKIVDKTIIIRDHGSTVAAYSTKAEADNAAKELSKATGSEHIARRGQEYENFYEKDFSMYQSALSSTKRRGEQLAGYGEKGLANIEDPIESLYRSVRALSSRLSYDDLLESLRNRWMKSYGNFIASTDGMKKFPRSANELVKQAGSAEDYKRAVALLDHISNMSRIPAKSDKMWQSFMMDFSEILEKVVPKSVAVSVKELGGTSPAAMLRKLPSVLFIALRPLRQALVQSMQLLQYSFIDPKYIVTGGFSRDMIGLSIARATFDKPAMYARTRVAGAKLMGVSEKEYDEIVDAYLNKSGLPYSIDSNFYVEGLVRDIHETTLLSPLKRTAAGVANTGRKVVQYSKAVGFDVGEFTNLTGSWLIARRKFLDANPELAGKWVAKEHQDQIAAHARELSYAMSTAGAFKYQKGLLAIPLQFVAVPHKAMLSMLPEMMGGSKAFSKSDKVAIAAANLIWFGGAGVGINKLVDAIQDEIDVQLDPQLNMAIRGGLVDISMNTLFNILADENNDGTAIKFSDSFAPMSGGLFFQDVMSKLLYEDWRAAVFGPSYNIVGFENSRMRRAFDDISAITSLPDTSTPEKLQLSMLAVASIASGVNDYMKYRYAMSTGKLVSARGDDIIGATRAEAMAKLFGFTTYKEEDIYTYLKDSYDSQKELQDYSKKHYEAIERAYKLYGKSDPETYKMHLTAWQSMLSSLDPSERRVVAQHLEKLAQQKMTSTGDSLIRRMLMDASNGGEIRENMLDNVRRSTALTDEQKKALLQLLDDSMNGELLNGQ